MNRSIIKMERIIPLFAFIICISSGLLAQDNSAVLLKVGDTPVTVEEFSYIYEKNNGENADYSKESVEEYLDLYTKFKLKVAKARSMQMDTIPELKAELETYRRQLASSYLMNKEVLDKLVKQAFERRKQDVQIAHILIAPVKGRGKRGQIEALEKTVKLKAEIEAGKITFEEAALKNSSDQNTAKNGGVMAYLTAMLPPGFLELENAMYELKPGEISEPIKTKLGFHLVKVVNRRPARGVVDISHILIRKELNKKPVPNAEELAMEAYNQLLLGKPWNEVVAEYSDDKETKTKRGALGRLGIGVYSPAFEDAAFSLEKDGDFTMPVETKSGFHIIRRNYKEDLNDFDAYRRQAETRIEKKPRFEEAKKDLIAGIKEKYNYKINEEALNHFTSTVNKDFYTFKWRRDTVEDIEIFRFNEDVYKLEQFVDYLKKNVKYRQRYSKNKPPSEAVREMLEQYSDEESILYEETKLEATYPDFRNLMREYREGILLFEASKVHVWDKASNDSLGLKRFYENNRKRYQYAPVARVVNYVLKSTKEKDIKKVIKHAKKNDLEKSLKKFNKKDEFYLKAFEGDLAQDKKLPKGLDWKEGAISDPQISGAEGKTTFTKIISIGKPKQKSLTEARGYVIADYQDHLEKLWIKDLKASFKVEVDEAVLKSIIKE